MKLLSKVLFLLLSVTGLSYSMDSKIKNKVQPDKVSEELLFHNNIVQLDKHIADFVNDFKTWSKEDQDKIAILRSDKNIMYVVIDKPAAADKYPGGDIRLYLDHRLNYYQITPFVLAIDYLKKQKQAQQ